MAVEDVINLVKKVATEVIPDNITFTNVKVESSNVVLYTPNLEIFNENKANLHVNSWPIASTFNAVSAENSC